MNKEPLNNNRLIWIAIGIFGTTILIVILYMWLNNFSVAETGTLGDAFNGLLAPFISFAGALLVYLSFREQIVANRIISTQWTFDLHLRIFEGIKADFNKIKVLIPNGKSTDVIEGNDAIIAIYTVWDEAQRVPEAMGEIEIVAKELVFLIEKINVTKMENKEYILNKIILFYNSSFKEAIPAIKKEVDKPGYSYKSVLIALDDLVDKVQKIL